MVRLFFRSILALLANAIGLLVAALLLDKFSINVISFVIATAIFTLSIVILSPLLMKIAFKHVRVLMGGVSLVTTFIGLIITNLISDGIRIQGMLTWVEATVIVWAFSLIATIVLPIFLFKKALETRRNP